MTKLSLLAALLIAACGGGPADPHDPGSCDDGWTRNDFEQCEKACENSGMALGASGPSCSALTVDNIRVICQRTLVYEGYQGCCVTDSVNVRFAECEE